MFSSSDKGPNATAVLAECLYNLGLCHMEEGNLQMVSVCLEAEIICDFHTGCLHQFCFWKATHNNARCQLTKGLLKLGSQEAICTH